MPLVGKAAPTFECDAAMPDGSFKTVKLSDYKGKYVVLFFYPLDFTFVCPTEINAFSDAAAKFEEIGATLLGASIDSKFCHLAFSALPRTQGGLGGCKFPLLADVTKSLSEAYDVLITEGPDAGISLRGLFIIDTKGTLRQATVNDLPVGRSVDEALRLVKAFQFVDQHGEVCPANWTPGEKTMKADPTGSLEYFSKLS